MVFGRLRRPASNGRFTDLAASQEPRPEGEKLSKLACVGCGEIVVHDVAKFC